MGIKKAHKLKRKANEAGYGIMSGYNINGSGVANVFYGLHRERFAYYKAETEAEAIVKAYEFLQKKGLI